MILAGLAVIRPSRIAAFSAARIVARIRVSVAADTGVPAAPRWRLIPANMPRRSAVVSMASGTCPIAGIR